MTEAPQPQIRMRSWLFAPGDSVKKMTKAAEGAADIVLFDLEDAVVESGKASARAAIAEFLAGKSAEERARLWVRINPLDGEWTADDLAAIMPARPGGIMLPKSRGRGDVEELDRQMTALEVENGVAPGSTPVIALVTETAAAMFTTGDYGGAPRLAAMTWGAEDLADSLGAQSNKDFEGDFAFTYKLARSLCLLGAAAAEVMPVETIDTNFRDLEALRKRAIEVRRQGYRGMLAIHPAQVPVINEAFTPSEEEIAEAREIVELFEADPSAGTIGWKGGMLDRPHLSRARQLLAQIED
ncbi:MAG: CoA ester lyase [Erythrobacter sp.]|jgi:citrate lyase subunit beta/citryl-CoA lyase|uniref:HpcH/HpaI aldolase/citrate lyase family protein n=1 Tax=Qipengyuania citrea TaxID=225971 RepID=UPI00209FD850|nr:CoA ester lyase [Qipengyuania citrea]MCP2018890.1 citrate lyase subunit beta/citryl-CoA lyase [Qipengyuania citrea]MDE0902231.1 CoA ester lyase [Erythrobacter sp.]